MVEASIRRRASRRLETTPLETLAELVPALAEAIGPHCEVILHDLSKLPHSIIAIGGNLTGRAIGGPMTDFGLEQIRNGGTNDYIVGYPAQTRDGRRLRSSTMFVRDATGEVVGCLCVNIDVSSLLDVRDFADRLIGDAGVDGTTHTRPDGTRENFPASVEELTVTAVREVIAQVGVPVHLMRKDHKQEVVRLLEGRGLFLIRDAVEYVANALSISRYSVYKYLNELNPETEGAGAAVGRRRRRATLRVLPGVELEDASRPSLRPRRKQKETS